MNHPIEHKKSLVIGAGLAGLTAGFYLQKKGYTLDILEKKEKVGGVISSLALNGFLAECGPHSLQLNSDFLTMHFKDLGIEDDLVYAPLDAKRFVIKYKNLLPFPLKPFEMLSTPVLSIQAKIRAICDLFLKKENLEHISVGQFIENRFGKELVDYFLDPFVNGVYATDPYRLSLKYAFPKLYAMAQETRSILWALIKNKRKTPPSIVSFRNGMQTWVRALEDSLKDNIYCGSTIKNIKYLDTNKWYATFSTPTKEYSRVYDSLFLSTPAHALCDLPFENKEILNYLNTIQRHIPYAKVGCLTLGFGVESLTRPLSGFGFLGPSKERLPILGTLFTSSTFPNRAPEGYCTLATFLGGAVHADSCEMPIQSIEKQVMYTLMELGLLKKEAQPVFRHYGFWKNAVPSYVIGNYEKAMEALSLIQKKYPTLHFIGNYNKGVSLGNCAYNAYMATK